MMMDNKQNILRSFEGQKIDESVHVARWGAPVSNEEQNRNVFQKYAAGGSENTIRSTNQIAQSQQIHTQESQVREIDTGFKKLKNNQIEMLKEFKQEYEVLKSLNMEEKLGKQSDIRSSSSGIRAEQPSDIASSSSHRSKKRKAANTQQNDHREAQILALEKKQLQIVINNSMRKIEELLHSEMEYKKQIHELKMQVTGRNNTEVEYESMLKTLKKNEIGSQETIESLKKENEKLRVNIRGLNERISQVESEVLVKEQDVRRAYDEKRKTEELVRIEKDKYFNIEIDYKKVKMEYELLEKDKNSEINRLIRQGDFKDSSRLRDLESQLKRYREEVELKDQRYNILLNQLEDLRRRHSAQDQEIHQLKSSQNEGALDREHIEEILAEFRDKNDNVSFTENINEVLERLHEMDRNQSDYLRGELNALREEMESLREAHLQSQQQQPIIESPKKSPQPIIVNTEAFEERIEELQRTIKMQNSEKQELYDDIRRLKRDLQEANRRLNQSQLKVKDYESIEARLREEIKSLRSRPTLAPVENLRESNVNEISRMSAVLESKNISRELTKAKEEIGQHLNTIQNLKLKVDQVEEELRGVKRRADENEFRANKAETELDFKLRIQKSEQTALLSRIGEDLERHRRENALMSEELEKLKSTSEHKIERRDQQIEQLRTIIRNSSDQTDSSVKNLKLEYETLFNTERQRYKSELQELNTQVTTLTTTNNRYIQDTNKYLHYESELNCLKEIMRNSIHMSEGVNHLWRVKETEYQNVNALLRQISHWRY